MHLFTQANRAGNETLPRAVRGCLRTAASAASLAVVAGLFWTISPQAWRPVFAAIAVLNLVTALVLLLSVLLARHRLQGH